MSYKYYIRFSLLIFHYNTSNSKSIPSITLIRNGCFPLCTTCCVDNTCVLPVAHGASILGKSVDTNHSFPCCLIRSFICLVKPFILHSFPNLFIKPLQCVL